MKLLTFLFLTLLSFPSFAAVNCFSDGVVGVYLTTDRQYQNIGVGQITQARADVYRQDGTRTQTLPGAFLVWNDWSKTAIFQNISYNWGRNFETLPGNPFYLIFCGEMGTPLRPGMLP